mgnify:CR=1 FL=1
MSFLHEKVFDPILNSKDAPANIISGGNMNKIKLLELRKCSWAIQCYCQQHIVI